MTLSLVLTINNRSPEVSKAVADSLRLPGNQPDELIVVLDRPTPEAKRGALEAYAGTESCPTFFIELPGEPGWRGPTKAWNAGFGIGSGKAQGAHGDLLYCISSEVIQDAGNLDKARDLAAANPRTAIFGACHNSVPTAEVVGFPPGLLIDAAHPRPLGFIVCMPAASVKAIGGYDEAFHDGFWFDDDDFMIRLWRSGCDFLFTNAIHGTHQHHERPVLATPEGQAGIARNQALMLKKHGTTNVWASLPRAVSYGPDWTRWSHL